MQRSDRALGLRQALLEGGQWSQLCIRTQTKNEGTLPCIFFYVVLTADLGFSQTAHLHELS